MWEAILIQREMFSPVLSLLLMYVDVKKALMQTEGAQCTGEHHQKSEEHELFSIAETRLQNKAAFSCF